MIQVSQGGQFYVNQYLIEQGFADEAEESALSKVRTDPGLPGRQVLCEPIVHGVLRVELIQVSQGGQFYVNQYLIEQGFADESEESALSKVRTDPGLPGRPVLCEPVPHRAGVCL